MKKTAIVITMAVFAIMAQAQDAQQILDQSNNLFEAKKYTEAIVLLQNHETVFEHENRLSSMFGNLSWYYLFTKDFNLSKQAVHKALEADSTQIWVKTNLAHALLFQGKTAEAESIYYELANTIYYEFETYAATLLNDFEQLEKAGIIPPGSKNDLERIKTNTNSTNETIKIFTQFFILSLDDKYDEALTLLQPYISLLPKQHAQWAVYVLGNEGDKCINMGNYAEAEKYWLAVKTILEKVLGQEHPDYAISLNNLGDLYYKMGNYAEAEKHCLEAKTIREQVLGQTHPDYASSLNSLGVLYWAMGNYVEAENYLVEVKTICEQVLGQTHPDYATSLNNLGSLYQTMGNYAEAEKYCLEAKTIREQVLGQAHPDYVTSLNNLSSLYLETKNYIQAEAMKTEADQLGKSQLETNFAFLSEQQRSLFWDINKYNFEASYSYVYAYPVNSMISHVYDNTLFTKGLLLRTTNGIRDAIYASGNRELISRYEQLGNLRTQISALLQNDYFDKDYIQTLESRADSLDKAITQASQTYRDLKADISMTWQDVQQQLKPDEAAIEFVDFRLYDTRWTDTTIYAALVLRPGMEAPAWIPLCEAKELQACFDRTKGISDYRLDADRLKTNILYNIFGAELYSLVWQPLEKELAGVGRIYYASSGLLHKVAFDAIPVDDASRLFDRYEMKLVSSTREIKRLKEETAEVAHGSAVLYGGIDYEGDADGLIAAAQPYPQSAATRSFNSETRGSAWTLLPGSKTEMEQIASYLQSHQVAHETFTGVFGNEESFKSLSGGNTNQIVISTHGFFLEDIQKDHTADLIRRLGGGGAQKPFENPLLRSGLVLAGGNRVWTGQPPVEGIEDGILTADEISQLNLINTRLVVLSACQTGLGEVQNSEGVFGLQRAFKLAGVESLIMSLWEVDDKATQIMMSAFYENWLGGKTKQEAFRIAQKAVREHAENDYSSPYYWAAFVMMD